MFVVLELPDDSSPILWYSICVGNTTRQLGCCTILRVYSQDLGRLIVWVLREYQEIEPIILSGECRTALISKLWPACTRLGVLLHDTPTETWDRSLNIREDESLLITDIFLPYYSLPISGGGWWGLNQRGCGHDCRGSGLQRRDTRILSTHPNHPIPFTDVCWDALVNLGCTVTIL